MHNTFSNSPTIAPPTSPNAIATHVPAAWKPPWVPTDLDANSPSKSKVLINLGRKKKLIRSFISSRAKSIPSQLIKPEVETANVFVN